VSARDWRAGLPEGADALACACAIQRHLEPHDWPRALEQVREDYRLAAETYLRGIAERMRVARRARKAAQSAARGSTFYDQRDDGTPVTAPP
jgi:hypothetical protein